MHQAIEFFIWSCRPESLSELQALIQAHLNIVGNLDILVLKSQRDSDKVIKTVSLHEQSAIFSFKSETLISFEEGYLDSCQEAWIRVS